MGLLEDILLMKKSQVQTKGDCMLLLLTFSLVCAKNTFGKTLKLKRKFRVGRMHGGLRVEVSWEICFLPSYTLWNWIMSMYYQKCMLAYIHKLFKKRTCHGKARWSSLFWKLRGLPQWPAHCIYSFVCSLNVQSLGSDPKFQSLASLTSWGLLVKLL